MDTVSIRTKVSQAIRQGKKSVIVNGSRIKLPEPQRTGTYSQIEAYITQQTDKVVATIEQRGKS